MRLAFRIQSIWNQLPFCLMYQPLSPPQGTACRNPRETINTQRKWCQGTQVSLMPEQQGDNSEKNLQSLMSVW